MKLLTFLLTICKIFPSFELVGLVSTFVVFSAADVPLKDRCETRDLFH